MEGAKRGVWSPPAVDGNMTLRLSQVQVFFRHGDRSPTPLGDSNARLELWASRLQDIPACFPTYEYFPQAQPWGQLTKKGAEQARALGEWMKENYLSTLCGSEPLVDILHVRSTKFLRTHLTAWYVLEGLLGSPEAAATIPISFRDLKNENLYHNDHCPRLAKRWKAAWRAVRDAAGPDGTMASNWHMRYKDLQAAVTNYLGIPHKPGQMDSSTSFPWVTAVDAMECGMHHGDSLPDGATDAQIVEVRDLLALDYAKSFQDREILQLSMGRLMKEILEATLRSDKSAFPRLLLYSGHDATILPLSVALGAQWQTWPPYTASICIERWSSSEGEQFVRILYDGHEVPLPVSDQEHKSTQKKTLLTLEEFAALADWSLLSEDTFQELCQNVSEL